MTVRFKKLIAATFLVLTLIPLVVFVSTQIQKHIIFNEMKEKLENKNLQTISMPSSKINWINYGEEAMIDGEMFDVKSFTQKNNTTTLVGLYDAKEKELNKKSIDFTKEKHQQSTSTTSSLLFLAFFDNSCFTFSFNKISTHLKHIVVYTKNISCIYLDQLTPPPDFS